MPETDPICERISQAIAAAVSTVTVANGYQQDLALQGDGTRCHRPATVGDFDRDPPGQYAAQLIEEPPARQDEGDGDRGDNLRALWSQTFNVDVFYHPSDAATAPVMQVLARLWADVVKAVMLDPQHGGLAERTEAAGPQFEMAVNSGAIYATAPFEVFYRADVDDPYSQ